MAGITIGRLAERAGVNIDTIRCYERHGLPGGQGELARCPIVTALSGGADGD